MFLASKAELCDFVKTYKRCVFFSCRSAPPRVAGKRCFLISVPNKMLCHVGHLDSRCAHHPGHTQSLPTWMVGHHLELQWTPSYCVPSSLTLRNHLLLCACSVSGSRFPVHIQWHLESAIYGFQSLFSSRMKLGQSLSDYHLINEENSTS